MVKTTLKSLIPGGLILVLLTASCQPELEPAMDEASVIVNNTSVRAEPTSASRTLFRLAEGERVSILEKDGVWYRVRDSEDFEGWMEESTVLRDSTLEAMRAMLASADAKPVQNTMTTLEEVNLRLAPGRDTDIIRRLRRNVALEVLDRQTTPRPDSDATDIWFEVRPAESATEIGWVYSQLVQFDTPPELQPFTEDRIYAAVLTLNEVIDPEAGPVRWYVVGERRPGADPEIAFDGVRVFTWNLQDHHYETSLRLRNLNGIYPVAVIAADPPTFRFSSLDQGGTPQTREFVMRGTVAREVRVSP